MTTRLVSGDSQHNRICRAEQYALDRKLAVARLKDELAPRIKKWRRWRWLRRMLGR